ncbi:MAG: hypothetical protein H6713_15300 [Myxococcales bacterium]|nr:hypothetical protein [Myxococcales bacterium]
MFSDLPVMIAAALWREDPRGWEAPGWLLHHERRELRKAGRQLAQLHREFHRRALLRLLRRRPRPTA